MANKRKDLTTIGRALAFIAVLSGPAKSQATDETRTPCTEDAMIVFDASGSMAGNTVQGLFSDINRIDEVRKALAQVLPGSLRQSAINPNQRASRRGHGYASSAIPYYGPGVPTPGPFLSRF
jgi:hypothetical protein